MANSNARNLRKAMTRQEVQLWQRLRELRTLGHHFRRQSPLAPYIVDFECRRSRVIVEVDGHQHGHDENRKRDTARDNALAARGYRILRFSNGDVDRELDGVMEAICLALASVNRGIGSAIPPREGCRIHTSSRVFSTSYAQQCTELGSLPGPRAGNLDFEHRPSP